MRVRQGFVDIEGHRLAYLAVNEHLARPEQPAVVFIHGVLASVNFWLDAVPPDFRDNRAWYALSLPAHHPSTVPADFGLGQVDDQWFYRLMNGALEQLLGGRKATVVGHSTGGFSALNLAIHRAPSVVGIVSVAGFHRGEWGGVEGLLVKLAGLGKWAKPLFELNILIARYSGFVQRRFTTLLAHDREAFSESPLSQRMLENIRPNTRGQDPAALFYLFNGISKLEIGDRLRDIRIPCHVLAGSHDPVVPAAQSLLIAGEVPDAKTVVFRNVGHMPFMESTEQYFEALERALADITHRSDSAARAA
jgi:pimeloyl-ACP methyl ester carboxylesterase